MWNLITHMICFGAGTAAGVVLMCLMQARKQADEEFEEMRNKNQAGRDEPGL